MWNRKINEVIVIDNNIVIGTKEEMSKTDAKFKQGLGQIKK